MVTKAESLMMKKTYLQWKWVALAAVTCLMIPAMVWAGDLDLFKHEKGTLRISGGTAHIPVMKEAARRVMEAYPEIRIKRKLHRISG